MVSTVTVRGQTAIPAVIRRKYNIGGHTKIEWIDNGRSISVVPIPKDPLKALRGKFRRSSMLEDLLKERKRDRERE